LASVLIVEADQRVLSERAEQLLMDGYQVDAVGTFEAARIKLADRPDALVLANAGSGPETIALLRQLRAGEIARADPALPSTSSPLLVAAGLESLARRTGSEQRRQVVRVGSLTVDCDARTAEVEQRAVKLTRLEFDLLQTLASQPRRTFTRAELTREVWGYDPRATGPSRTIDSHAYRLRHKLEQAGTREMVQTVRGVGWRLTQ